ncbi:LysR substrate-binding domain-containing protein [Desulfospira joergensenii]|uniref:LysR substrate-binding domain-containing protein n=1 Tax=Desulfospira joergensenii TaxID=53329 RepID=UPI0003B771FF|nr:LysR substrate-binding domain-containing protein [Desulfospira joergensenii]
MPDTIPIELLRTFSTIADSGSFSVAADQVSRTQSAVSMQIKRLEELIEKPLIQRDSRNLKLTDDGFTLLHYARQILKLNKEALSLLRRPELKGWVSIGLPDDYAARFLPEILASFSRTHPRVQVQVTCEPSNRLVERIQKKKLDLAMVTSPSPEIENGILLRQDQTVWVTSERHCQHEASPLPLALFPDDCYCRKWVLSSLEKSGIEYRIAYTSPSIMGLQAAVTAGLAVTAVSQSIVPPGIRQLSPEEGFPPLPNASFLLQRNPESNNCIVDSLAEHISKAFSTCSEFGRCLA